MGARVSIATVPLNIYVHGHPPIFRYCTSERRRGARVGVRLRRLRARVRPRGVASALGYSRRSECTGVSITCVRVCVRAWRFSLDSARSTARLPDAARWAVPHARALHGRFIDNTKVKALPEWLCNCKLLESVCVPPAARRRARLWRCRRCAAAACAAAPGAGPAPRGVGCGGGGVSGRAESRPHWWRAGGRATPRSRRCRRRPTGPT
jgi:hypothetical protein